MHFIEHKRGLAIDILVIQECVIFFNPKRINFEAVINSIKEAKEDILFLGFDCKYEIIKLKFDLKVIKHL